MRLRLVPSVAILGAATVLYVALAHFFAKQVGDDSFIFYRVADNVLGGRGPVYNPGEHVEAYSSPLWLGALAGGRALGVPYESFSRFAGDGLAALAVLTGVAIARRLGAGATISALVALAGALTGSVHYWAPAGLDTPAYALVVGACTFGVVATRPTCFTIATALLGVARPEGPFLVPIAVAAYTLAHGRRSLGWGRLAALVAPAFAYEVFRLAYFHAPLPNTYYAKATGALGERVVAGIDYAFWPLLALGASTARAIIELVRGRRLPLAALLVPGAIVGAVVAGGGDWMWGHRMLVPAFAPIFGVIAAQVSSIQGRPRLRVALAAAALFVAINDDLPWPSQHGYDIKFGVGPITAATKAWDAKRLTSALDARFVVPVRTIALALEGKRLDPGDRVEGTMTEVSRDVARWLDDRYEPGSVLAVNHAGAVPYYSRFPVIDMTGLADWHIAHEVSGGLHRKYDPPYVLARRPRAIVLNSRVEPGQGGVWYHEGYWEGETALVHDPEFGAHYRPAPVFFRWDFTQAAGNYILVYERTGP